MAEDAVHDSPSVNLLSLLSDAEPLFPYSNETSPHLSLLCVLLAGCNSEGAQPKSGTGGSLKHNYVLGAAGGKVPEPTEFALFNDKDLSNWDFELADESADDNKIGEACVIPRSVSWLVPVDA